MRLGVDFGTDRTIIAAAERSGDRHEAVKTLAFPGWSRNVPSSRDNFVPVIPSQVHYKADGSLLIGEEAAAGEYQENPSTARRMKHYIAGNCGVRIPAADGRQIGYDQAAKEFLVKILRAAPGERDPGTIPVIFTVPPEAPVRYIEWIEELAESAGFKNFGTIDKPVAIATGYEFPVSTGLPFLIIDVTSNATDVIVVIPQPDPGENNRICSRIPGRSSDDFGGAGIDTLLARHILEEQRLHPGDSRVTRIFGTLVRESGRAREQIVTGAGSLVQCRDPSSGFEVKGRLVPADIGKILTSIEIRRILNRVIDRALSAAQLRGFDPGTITGVLMTGEISVIPEVQEIVRARFACPVLCNHPLDAAARGAALIHPPEVTCIRYDYALRYWDPAAREHRYRFLVRSGTRYPSSGQVARITISASYDGQTHLGIPLYRIGDGGRISEQHSFELVGTPEGGMHLAGPSPDADASRQPVWVNRKEPVYLVASPPARKSEPRFELRFTIDRSGYLCLSVKDVTTGILVKKDERFFKLVSSREPEMA